MKEMPMHNYSDLPRETIEPWVQFLESLDATSKIQLMERSWNALTSFEQNLVIVDLKEFFSGGGGGEIMDENSNDQ